MKNTLIKTRIIHVNFIFQIVLDLYFSKVTCILLERFKVAKKTNEYLSPFSSLLGGKMTPIHYSKNRNCLMLYHPHHMHLHTCSELINYMQNTQPSFQVNLNNGRCNINRTYYQYSATVFRL